MVLAHSIKKKIARGKENKLAKMEHHGCTKKNYKKKKVIL